MVETSLELNVTLVMDWNGYEKKTVFRLKGGGRKGVPVEGYRKGEVKLLMNVCIMAALAQARLYLDLVKSNFQPANTTNKISPKRHQQAIT